MKTKLFFLILFASFCANAQVLNITDPELKNILLGNDTNAFVTALDSNDQPIQINSNGDGEIQLSEALQVTSIYIYPINGIAFNVASINGFSLFDNLKKLNLNNFKVVNINLSTGFLSLEDFQYVQANINALTSLVVSDLSNLQKIHVESKSQFTSSITNLQSLNALSLVKANGFTIVNSPNIKQFYISTSVLQNSLDLTMFSGMENIGIGGMGVKNVICSGLINLKVFSCMTGLKSLHAQNLPNIQILDCGPNDLEVLQIGIMPKLTELWLVSSHITTLDLSESPLLDKLYIILEAATFINLKNGKTTYSGITIDDNDDIETYWCVDDGEQLPMQFIEGVVGSYCSFTPGGSYNTITGTTIFDIDNNGCDTGDAFQGLMKVKISDGTNTGATFTNSLSQYKFYTQAGNFTITPEFENSWFTATPATASVNFSNNNNNTSTNNFCITSVGSHPDVEVVVYPISNAQPGFDAWYKVVYKNKGNQALSGAVTFNYDDAVLDFVSATPVQSASATGQLTFNYNNLLPFEDRSVEVKLNLNGPMETPPLNNGDYLNFSVTITPTAGDETPGDNTFSIIQEIVGSYDPNDIICLEGGIVSPAEIGDYLHYVVNFENTGTAPTTFIVVKVDVNPAQYDIASLRVMNTSHASDIRVTGNRIEFMMPTAALAAGDHGNILFKMKTKDNLIEGNMVKQKANIYFDYNFPIVTNDANTTFQALSTGSWTKDDSVKVYPNPSAGMMMIEASSVIKSIELYDVQGRLLEVQKQGEVNTSIDMSTRAKGIYFAKVITERGVKVEKIIRE